MNTRVFLALFCFAVATMLLLVRPYVSEHLELLRNAPVLDARSVRMLDHGESFRLSAVVAASNEPAYRDLVAFDIEEWSPGTGGTSGSWHTASMHRPPLMLRGLDADTLTLRGGYLLLDGKQYDTGDRERYRGLVAGDSVGVYGTMSRTSGSMLVLGESVILGDAATLMSNQKGGLRILNWMAGVAIATGAVFLGLHARRRRVEAAPAH
jgi:hypothetical protein